EVDDPAALVPVLVDEVQLRAHLGARFARKAIHLLRPAEHEEHRIALAQPELLADRFGTLRSDVLGHRSGALEHITFLAPEDVGEARLSGALRPAIHAVAEGTAAAGLARNRPDFGFVVGGNLP